MRQFFLTVPNDLIDAVRMDGLSELAIVWRVMLPGAIPAVTAFGIYSVVVHWNDYFWPLIALNSNGGAIPGSHEPPAYAIVLADADTVVVHTHDYLDASPKFSMGSQTPDQRAYALNLDPTAVS